MLQFFEWLAAVSPEEKAEFAALLKIHPFHSERAVPLLLGCAADTAVGPPVCGLSIDELLERIGNIGRQLKGYTEKLVFSFIDIGAYRKVQRNLEGLGVREFSPDEQRQFAQGLAERNKN